MAQDLEDVEQRISDVEARLATITERYETAWEQKVLAEDELAGLAQRRIDLAAEVAEVDARLADRARWIHMYGSDNPVVDLFGADGPGGAIRRASLRHTITVRERTELETATGLQAQLDQLDVLLGERQAELDLLVAALSADQDELQSALSAAQNLATDLRARRARQRTIQRGVQNGIYACIFDRGTTHFRNTWGAPRSGGRSHKGTDVFAAYNAPVLAFTNGRIDRISSSGLGGLGLYLWGDDGNLYYYAHLASTSQNVWVGKAVEAGEHIAFNGDSGNARGGAPHVHFELHPGGGAQINPYEWLAAACF